MRVFRSLPYLDALHNTSLVQALSSPCQSLSNQGELRRTYVIKREVIVKGILDGANRSDEMRHATEQPTPFVEVFSIPLTTLVGRRENLDSGHQLPVCDITNFNSHVRHTTRYHHGHL